MVGLESIPICSICCGGDFSLAYVCLLKIMTIKNAFYINISQVNYFWEYLFFWTRFFVSVRLVFCLNFSLLLSLKQRVAKVIGHGNTKDSTVPQLIEKSLDKCFVKIACGRLHCLALSYSGILYGWGDSSHGQLGTNEV